MTDAFHYRTLRVRDGGDSVYLLKSTEANPADSGSRPNEYRDGSEVKLAEYLNALGKDGWEVCAYLPGNGAFSTLVLKRRD